MLWSRGAGTADARDAFAAHEFVRAARVCELPRSVFFSIFMPPGERGPTRYQANRLAVERILLEGISGMVVLRSGISLGSGLRGIRPYLKLAQRLPLIPLGPWRRNTAAVVDLGTELECLVGAATWDGLAGRAWEVPPSAEPTHEELVRALIDVLGLRRPVLRLPLASEWLDARLIATITGEDYELCDYLVSVLRTDYRCTLELTEPFRGIAPQPMGEALAAAVRDWRELPRYLNGGRTTPLVSA